MRKLSLLIFHKDYQRILGEIRDKGAVHIQENKKRSDENLEFQSRLLQVKKINEMLRRLEGRLVQEEKEDIAERGDELLNLLEQKYLRIDKIAQELAGVQKEYAQYEPWGDFSRERVEALGRAGWEMRFFSAPDRKYNPEWENSLNAMPVGESRGQVFFVTLTPVEEKIAVDADPFVFPAESREALAGRITALKDEASTIGLFLDRVAENAVQKLKIYREKIGEETDWCKVNDASMILVDDKVIALEGWVPVNREEEMKNFLLNEEVYFEFTVPTPEDDVPVLLKNNAFSRLFEPITEMFALPNYNELDPTPFFAPFFMLFFGLCMGDAGYGLLIWLVCFFIARKASPSLKGLLLLGEYLGAAAVLVGILTGSFFGIALDAVEWPWLKGVKEYFITQANYGRYLQGYNPMMIVAVVIGVIQILLGMCLSAAKLTKQYGFKYALSVVSWVVALITLGVTFGLPAFGIALPSAVTYLLYAILSVCTFFIVFMNAPGKGILSNVGGALWGTYNMATGLLGDTLSYIRLFALGLTGSILGGVFNTLAFDLTASLPPVVQYVAAFLILLAGHTINFGLCMIGAFVHPMRLTFVEFYKNATFEGGGKKYQPFRKRTA